MTDFARALTRPHIDPARYRQGTVAATHGAVCDILIDGATITVPTLAGVALAIGQSVILIRSGTNGTMIIGVTGTPATLPNTPIPPSLVSVDPGRGAARLNTATVLPTSAISRWWNKNGLHVDNVGDRELYESLTQSGGEYTTLLFGNRLTALHADLNFPCRIRMRIYPREIAPWGQTSHAKPRPWIHDPTQTLTQPDLAPGVPALWQLPDAAAHSMLTTPNVPLGFGYPQNAPYTQTYAITYYGRALRADSMSLLVEYYA